MSKIYSTLRYLLIVFLAANVVQSFGQSLACNGGVNISMDENCEVVLDASHILKGPDADADPEDFLLSIKKPDGSIPTEILVYDPVNHEYTDTLGNEGVFIKFITSGNYVVSVKRISDGTRCWGDLRIEDKLPPYTDSCPCSANDPTPDEDCIFNCASINLIMDSDSITGVVGVNPVFKDNCSSTGDVSFYDVLAPDTSCGAWILTRTWTSIVTDFHGTNTRELNCVQKFIFKSTGVEAITPPSNKVIVTCGIDTDPMSLREYFSNPLYFNNPNLDTAIVRSYPSISDTIPVHGIVRRAIGEGLSDPSNGDNLCKITATYTDSPNIEHCGDIGYKFVRTWHIVDWCSLETPAPFTQIIKVTDTIAPEFTIMDTIAVSSTNPWTCDSDIIVPAPDTLYDNCSSASQISWIAQVDLGGAIFEANSANGYRLDGLSTGTYSVKYIVSDLCDNKREKESVIVIKDLIKPVALAKYRVKVVFSTYQGECTAKIFAHNVDAGSFDACDDDLDYGIRRKGDSLFTNFVKFTDLDLDDVTAGGTPFGEVLIELRVVDDCGNYSIGWTTVVIEDKNTDVTKICGVTEVQLDCTSDLDTAIANNLPRVILNGCSQRDLPIIHSIRSNNVDPLCNTGDVIVDYFIEGSVDTFCTKTFSFRDPQPLSITWPDANITVTCDSMDFGDVIITGGMCTQARPTEKLRDIFPPSGLGYCKKIIRELTVIDWCNYNPNTGDTSGIHRFVQVIKVVDNQKPTIQCTDLEVDAGDNCDMTGIVVTASGVDGGLCQSTLSWEAAVDLDDDGIYETELVVTSTGDSTVSATISQAVSVGAHNIRWRAADGCGNSDEAVCTITIVDNIDPDPKCVTALSTATMEQEGMVNIWAADFDPMGNSTDNCSQTLTYSFSETDPNVPNMMFTCEDLPDNVSEIIELKVYVWDESGNNSFCNVTLQIDDNVDACQDSNMTASAVISGMIVSSLGDHVELAEVRNSSMNSQNSNYEMTNVEGEYSFDNNVMMSGYELNASKSGDDLNGVSTLDVLLIQRHILGLNLFEDAYQTIAADVNGDQRVSSLDLVTMRSLILGRTQSFPNGQSWKFIDANQVFNSPLAPWPLEESLYISQLQTSQLGNDFVGIKLGDVNGNAIANSKLSADSRSNNRIAIETENHIVQKGQVVSVKLDLNQIENAYGIQLGLNLENGIWLNARSVEMNLSSDHFSIDGPQLKISWNEIYTLERGGALILTFEANASGALSEFISLDQSGFSSQAYVGENLESKELDLSFNNIFLQDLIMHQNIPNPFNGNTSIEFSIAKRGQVEFSIFDITGRQLHASTANYDAGKHKLTVDESIVNQKGVLYYQISFGDKIATKKMISIE